MTLLHLPRILKELRKFNNYTQQDISSQLHIGRSSYSNYELGKRTPTIEQIITMADFYQISLDDLLRNPYFSPATAAKSFSFMSNDERLLLSLYRPFAIYDKQHVIKLCQKIVEKSGTTK